jgi:molybdate transport system ATP-binding protein
MTGSALHAEVVVDRGRFRLAARVHAAPGEIVAVMGPSGAGKSTLFDAIAGFTVLDDGEVRLDGQNVDAASGPHLPPHARSIVLLGQEPRLFPHLSARENVAFGPRARGVSRHAARADADTWLRRVGLPDAGDRRPARLSGGQQQRVALARALAIRPRLLLLDEPLSALDPRTAEDIRALLRDQLAATETTTLVATHAAVDAAALATRLIVLENGAVTQEGAVGEVLHRPATPFVSTIAATLPHPAEAGWSVRVMRVEPGERGVRVVALTAAGDETTFELPPGVEAAPGATISVRAPQP